MDRPHTLRLLLVARAAQQERSTKAQQEELAAVLAITMEALVVAVVLAADVEHQMASLRRMMEAATERTVKAVAADRARQLVRLERLLAHCMLAAAVAATQTAKTVPAMAVLVAAETVARQLTVSRERPILAAVAAVLVSRARDTRMAVQAAPASSSSVAQRTT